jgi:phenylacetic acid degradation operon negative regulatory protein
MKTMLSESSWLSGAPNALKPQDLAITTLGAYGRGTAEPIWSGGMVRLLGEFGFSVGAARVALGRLARSGLLERIRMGRQIHYAMTPSLESLLAEGDAQIFGLGVDDEWSGMWTVLWQSVPDELGLQRRRLAGRLRFLGFGPVQNGTWVSPHDRTRELASLIDDLAIGQHVGVIVGRPATDDALQTLIAQAWDLDALAGGYERYLEQLRPFRSARSRARLSDRDAFVVRTRAVHEFRRFPSQDPGLPEEIVSRRWKRGDAVAGFHELYDLLAEPAQRHFDAAMAGGRPAAATGARSADGSRART